ncbi:hypothetical protein PACTADRAFT_185381 [Pachysolen tannophilus NRRL Y-2460]|uniref:Low temperature requirement protein A n=1 Tax=Pachysolen tannophilus NRRL Y-2460 TaxID=669874 RepID=A0A1E4U2H2_PACTA|nr:hypothetical protein PACTADRAFT_185381 [Pachysolen tannophilus NRRL Y-2460]
MSQASDDLTESIRPRDSNGVTRETLDEDVDIERISRSLASEEELEYEERYETTKVIYIEPPERNKLFTRPYALNYYCDNILYRTKDGNSASALELFLDLLYVGIVSSLAAQTTLECTGLTLLKYVLFFVPVWVVWVDLKDFMNYYFNDDMTQRTYVLWIMLLLVIYVNNCVYILQSHGETAMVVVPYMMCRYSVAVTYIFYSFFVPQHRIQIRIYSALILVVTCAWISVIFVSTRAKVGLTIGIMFLEQVSYVIAFHPITKKLLKLKFSTALNVEREVSRFGAFYTIAIGEFLYNIVTSAYTGPGIHEKLWKALLTLIIAYIFMFVYFDGTGDIVHLPALTRSVHSAYIWIFIHVPLIGSLVLVAYASSNLISLDEITLSKGGYIDKMSLYGLSFFFSGGTCITLVSLGIIAMSDKTLEDVDSKYLSKIIRVFPRFPIAIAILCLSFAELKPAMLIGLTTLMLSFIFIYERIILGYGHLIKANNKKNLSISSSTPLSEIKHRITEILRSLSFEKNRSNVTTASSLPNCEDDTTKVGTENSQNFNFATV